MSNPAQFLIRRGKVQSPHDSMSLSLLLLPKVLDEAFFSEKNKIKS